MENKQCSLKQRLENYFEARIGLQYLNKRFSKLMLYLDEMYRLSDVYNFDVELAIDKEKHNKYYKFSYNIESNETDIDTTIYIFFILKSSENINLEKFGIVFDEIVLGEKDYPYGKTTTYLLDGTIETRYFDYNEKTDIDNNNDYIKKLIKKKMIDIILKSIGNKYYQN